LRLVANPSPFRFLLGNPPPLSPSLHKGGGSSFIREASPLFNSPSDPLDKGRGKRILKGAFYPAFAPFNPLTKQPPYFYIRRYELLRL
jgi:hypothetical protein